MSVARTAEQESWPIEPELLSLIQRTREPDKLLIYETDTDNYWLSDFALWTDPEVRFRRALRPGGPSMVHLRTSLMRYRHSETELKPVRGRTIVRVE
jgi:hypothetical protein